MNPFVPSNHNAHQRTVLASLNQGLQRAFAADERVILLGEDVVDPYGGAFKVTHGLSTHYPGRVLTTPISEAGFTGLAAGMALRGLRPVVEIMFGDFLTLAADALLNHAAKFRWMYNDQVRVPLVLRTPMGGRRGYGPTHSQTLEKHFLGTPGMQVIAPCALGDPGQLLEDIILYTEDPVLFIENKLLYLLPVQSAEDLLPDFEQVVHPTPLYPTADSSPSKSISPLNAPCYTLRVQGAPKPTLTLAAYGYMAELARQAALKLAYEHEIFVELVIPTCLRRSLPFELSTTQRELYSTQAPIDMQPLLASLESTGRLLVIEEGTLTLGWGAEIIARCAEVLGTGLRCCRRVAAQESPIPASGPLENAVLPGLDDIIQAVQSMI